MEEALEVGEDGIYSGSFNLNLSPSTPYGVLISRDEGKSWITVAQFHTGTRDNTAVGVVLSLFFIFSLLGTYLFCYVTVVFKSLLLQGQLKFSKKTTKFKWNKQLI